MYKISLRILKQVGAKLPWKPPVTRAQSCHGELEQDQDQPRASQRHGRDAGLDAGAVVGHHAAGDDDGVAGGRHAGHLRRHARGDLRCGVVVQALAAETVLAEAAAVGDGVRDVALVERSCDKQNLLISVYNG